MNLILLLWVALMIGSVAVRGSSAPADAPRSAAYLEFRNRLRRNMLVAAALPLLAYLVLFASAVVDTLSERDLALPSAAEYGVFLLIIPGVFVFPLAALCVTEYTSRPAAVRGASLVPRTARDYAPKWLFGTAGIVTVLGLTSPSLLLVDTIAEPHYFRAPRIDVHYGGVSSDLWLPAVYLVIALILAVATITQAVRRRDLDTETTSDKWSRSGVVARALALLMLAGILPIANALSSLDSVAWAYRSYLGGGGVPLPAYDWLTDLGVKSWSGWALAAAAVAALLALAVFAFPPHRSARTRTAAPAVA
ncbi:hypothetical protein [Gordonia sp. (in: high G+C Gram-positive bacteria)]|uniref:hypothetical protein n=1 Tax=Gordonia sp. (in: high G+C Gram-positive bacteria) TaxID=84139 RepID=UPI0026322381|nr:hypothetical protein [Gordonia sp. (in: high G+C Gram-positive bacteria)]